MKNSPAKPFRQRLKSKSSYLVQTNYSFSYNMMQDPQLLAMPAALMAAEEDLTIFRRFDEINILNLLILQHETKELVKAFKQLCPETTDQHPADLVWYLPLNPLAGRNPSSTRDGIDPELEQKRREVWQELKGKLKEYSELRERIPADLS
jgi:hypothetical protein